MPPRPNKNRVPPSIDKVLCEFLVSPHRKSGLRNYKRDKGISLDEKSWTASDEEKSWRISNRLQYLKRIYDKNLPEFADICIHHGINSPQSPPRSPPPSSKTQVPALISPSPAPPKKMNPIAASFLDHQVCLNDEFPSLRDNGMIFFRDDDVEIGESMNSILTIYQPLFDARDHDLVTLKIDPEDPSRLIHTYPGLPTFMFRDYDKVHKLERSEENPEIYSETKKKHKKLAFKIKGNKQLKLKTTEFELPFELATNKFDDINNTGATVMKNYRTLTLPVTEKIKQTCSFVFWKIMIQGETQDCFSDVEEEEVNVYDIAQNRARDPPGTRPIEEDNLSDVVMEEESGEESGDESGDESDEESDEESGEEYNGEGPIVFEDPNSKDVEGEQTDGVVPDGQLSFQANDSSTVATDLSTVATEKEIPFVGDVVDVVQSPNEAHTTVLSDHLKRLGRYWASEANKKAKLHNRKPMDGVNSENEDI